MLRTKKQVALREEVTHLLVPGAGIYLSETEWLGINCDRQNRFLFLKRLISGRVSCWQSLLITATPLTVRHRQSGDRITLKPGFTKN